MENLTPEDKNNFRKFFITKIDEIYKRDRTMTSDDLSDETDAAAASELRQNLEKISAREKELIKLCENALFKIDNGSFGICEDCEEQIPKGRLKALPQAMFCISCAEEKEMRR